MLHTQAKAYYLVLTVTVARAAGPLSGAVSGGPFDATGSACVAEREHDVTSCLASSPPPPAPFLSGNACIGVSTHTSVVFADGGR